MISSVSGLNPAKKSLIMYLSAVLLSVSIYTLSIFQCELKITFFVASVNMCNRNGWSTKIYPRSVLDLAMFIALIIKYIWILLQSSVTH